MSKKIPEIHIENIEHSDREDDSPDGYSEGLTDNELYECVQGSTLYPKKHKDIAVTDLEWSSDDERQVQSPSLTTEIFSGTYDLGETSEQMMNVQSPGKTQKSIVYSLKVCDSEYLEDYATDWEGLSASDDEDDYMSKYGHMAFIEASNENTNIRDALLTKYVHSPAVTPQSSKRPSLAPAVSPFPCFTDTELMGSEEDTFKTVKKPQRSRSFIDGIKSNTEDSDDSAANDNPFAKPRKSSLHIYNRKSQSPMMQMFRKKSEPILTDIEILDVSTGNDKKKKTLHSKVKCMSTNKKSKSVSTSVKQSPQSRKSQSKMTLLPSHEENTGAYTDIEEFANEDSDGYVEPQEAVAYVPETKREIIISNQNMKGDIALILPISKPSNVKLTIGMETDCGYSDVEELPGYTGEEALINCPTPEPPYLEASTIQNSESIKDNSKLKIIPDQNEPLTDTEELHLENTKPKRNKGRDVFESGYKPNKKSALAINVNDQDSLTDTEDIVIGKADAKQKRNKQKVFPKANTSSRAHTRQGGLTVETDRMDNLTDVEDLQMEGDIGAPGGQLVVNPAPNNEIVTDVEDLSDYGDEEMKYPDYHVVSSCNVTAAKESINPISLGEKNKLKQKDLIPQINMISPSPVPCATEFEDMSGEEDNLSNPTADECNLEPHSSTVHIRHMRVFKPSGEEVKGSFNQPDPLTDVEELEFETDKKKPLRKWKKDHKELPKLTPTRKQIIEDKKTMNVETDRCDSSYENLGGVVVYHEIKEGSVYPPQLGYSELATSTSSLGFETETLSELLFSSSSSDGEEEEAAPGDPPLFGPETPGILYKISKQLDKVPRYISHKRGLSAEEEREDFLDMPEETEELIELQDSVEMMINNIKAEERLLFPNRHLTSQIPLSESNMHEITPQKSYTEIDPIRSLSSIETQISDLIKEVEREEKEMMEKFREKENSLMMLKHIGQSYQVYNDTSSESEDEFELPRVNLRVGNKFGLSTIDISTSGGPLRRRSLNRSLPNMSHVFNTSYFNPFDHLGLQSSSSIEYIEPVKGVGFVNSGYCIWTSDEELIEGSVEASAAEDTPSKPETIENKNKISETQSIAERSEIEIPLKPSEIIKKFESKDAILHEAIPKKTEVTEKPLVKTETDSQQEKTIQIEEQKSVPEKKIDTTFKQAIQEEINDFNESALDMNDAMQNIQSQEDVERIIKQMESQLMSSKMSSEETETDVEDSGVKPYVTTPTLGRKGIGGSQRLSSREERPTVRIVTEFAEDSTDEEEEEQPAYYVTDPVERPKRRNVKFRFDSGDYRDDEESDKEEEQKAKAATRVDNKFQRMTSETKEFELEKSDGEFQMMVSQFSVEEMDDALQQWDKGGLTPSDLDSKSFTERSAETSPQEGSQQLEEEEAKDAAPPIPSPRATTAPFEPPTLESEPPQSDPHALPSIASKKMFWEQVSSGSIEKSIDDRPPIPKPRLSITTSIEKPDYFETSLMGEVSEIEKKETTFQEATSTGFVASGISNDESIEDSEMEYIQTHKDTLSYDNDAFDLDDNVERLSDFSSKKQKPIYERSISLPCDTLPPDMSTSSVRTKKRIFEAQIKKEMVVEQLMSQLEEESSPEHKSLKLKAEKPITTQAMVSRQIHTDIFSDEMDQQIDSLVPENKELRQQPRKDSEHFQEATILETSSPDTSISSSIADVLMYKSDIISRPSDSLEVHIDKSELEESEKEKELDEEIKAMEETMLSTPFSKEKDKFGSVTSSQGESEDTFSESDVTPEDARYKEHQDIHEWPTLDSKPDKKIRSIYTPEEHLPDTVWEVPVQESIENLQEETVQQIPSDLLVKEREADIKVKQPLTESEAREIAKEIVEEIEVEICKREAGYFDKSAPPLKRDSVPEVSSEIKRIVDSTNVKFRRTDTTTSSMEITDEDLRSSGIDSDISPLESQACQVFRDDHSGEDSSDDIDHAELGPKESFGEDVLEKTLAEVKESLEAVKDELIEEKKKKKDSITKESPSEFEFKVLSLENKMNESITESHYEEGSVTSESEKPSDASYKATFMDKGEQEHSLTMEIKAEVSLKHDEANTILKSKEEKREETKVTGSKETTTEETKKETFDDGFYIKDSHGSSSLIDEQSSVESHKLDESRFFSSGSSSLQSDSLQKSQQTSKSSESYDYDTVIEAKEQNISVQLIEHKQDNKSTEKEDKKDTDIQSSEYISSDGTYISKVVETSEISSHTIVERKQSHSEKCTIEKISAYNQVQEAGKGEKDEQDEPKDNIPEPIKSPIQEDALSTSSSSDLKAGSDTTGFDKPTIVVRKHKKSTISRITAELSDPYSSSGESHYQSFEQTSESLRTPGSRPLSSDVEGLVANLGIVTGSSEYESAVSGQSTTATSRDYQTAVSSLSSRDSMKSLDSESSGNLASVEVSSEASETLVPSAMELDEMETSKTPQPQYKIESPFKGGRSYSESNGQSVSFDISTEEMSEDEIELHAQEMSQKMKRSHEMTFQPEPKQITQEMLSSSIDDAVSAMSDSTGLRTVIELSRTESDRMDGSATSDQLTVSGHSEQLSLSESKETESTMQTRMDTVSTQYSGETGTIESVTITTSSMVADGIQSVSTQITSKSVPHSNGPTQVDYNVEYDEVESEVKKRPGHRRNGSTSYRPSMIPVFQGRDFQKKTEDVLEDSAESDKYTQQLTSKEGNQEEKKDVDEAEKLEEEFYQTEADQAFHRDMREGRVLKEAYEYEESKSYETRSDKSRLSSVAFSEDRPDSELAELLKQCSTDTGSEDPIERPTTPEPVEDCEIKDDTPEFSSEAQASVTELEMEYCGAFSRTSEYEAHVSPIREKGMLWEDDDDLAEAEAAFHSSHFPSMHETIHEDTAAEKHELETQELLLKEEVIDRTSPVPGITITQHMTPLLDESFVFPEPEDYIGDIGDIQPLSQSISSKASSETSLAGKEYNLETATTKSIVSDDFQDETSHATDDKTVFEKEIIKDIESINSESPTSDSFELLEKPDIADEFVIIEEVGKEAEEQDREGKSVRISGAMRRPQSSRTDEEEVITSPPSTSTKMTKIKYYSKGGAEEETPFEFESGTPPKADDKTEESSQEGSPPSALEDDFKPDVEAGKKWIEMQFQGTEPVAPIYGYDMDFERGPLEDIKEEDFNDLESSSKIGSMGSQVSHSIGSFGSVKESLSSTPDYDTLAGRRFFTRSGDHDDVSMSSLQEFESLEKLIALESTKHKSLGSQDSLTSSSNSKKHGSRSGGDDISLASLKEFEGLETACIAAERIEKKAKAEEESLLSEIEEGHESQASESESCVTVSVSGVNRDSDEDDYEKRMFEIDEIIRQAQTNVEQFMEAKTIDPIERKPKSDSLGHADSLEEMTKVPDLDLDQPPSFSKPYCGKSYITQWEDLGEDLLTSTDSLELRTQISKTSILDPFTTSTDSLEVKFSQDVMSVSTDSIEAGQKKKTATIMTDSIEVGEKSSMITSTDSLEGRVTQANSLDEEEPQVYSSSSGKEVDWSGSGKNEEGAINRMPPPRAEYLLGSTDSLEPTSSTATHATYQYCESDSVMSSSFTSGDSATMVDDDAVDARSGVWFDEGKPYVTEVIEPGDDEFSQVLHRTVEMPPQITKVSFQGQDTEKALREYIEKFDPGEDIAETSTVDASGNVHIKRVIQKRVLIRPEEMGGDTTSLKGEELENYLKNLTESRFPDHSSSPEHSQTITKHSTQWTVSQAQGETIKSEPEEKDISDSRPRGGRPPLKYDISVDEDPEFDPREHDWRFNLHTHLEHDEDIHPDELDTSSPEVKGPNQKKTSKK